MLWVWLHHNYLFRLCSSFFTTLLWIGEGQQSWFSEFYLCFPKLFSYFHFHIISTHLWLCLLLFLVKFKIKKLSQAGIDITRSIVENSRVNTRPLRRLPLSSSGGPSYDLSIAALKLSLQPRPRTMFWRGRWNGSNSLFLLTSDMAVCRLSKELDFFRPSVGPSSIDGGAAVDRETDTTRMKQCYNSSNHCLTPIRDRGGARVPGVTGWEERINPGQCRAHTSPTLSPQGQFRNGNWEPDCPVEPVEAKTNAKKKSKYD